MNINTKAVNYKLYENGAYGNKFRTWPSIVAFQQSNYHGSVTIRYKGNVGGLYCAYNVTDVSEKIREFVCDGADKDLFVFNESAPDERLTIQGEITHSSRGYNLFYSCDKGKMRDCLKNGISASGIKAKAIMQHFMSPSSFDDVMELIELYPNHVIEFSTYEMNLGSCRGRNTVIWEVRKY